MKGFIVVDSKNNVVRQNINGVEIGVDMNKVHAQLKRIDDLSADAARALAQGEDMSIWLEKMNVLADDIFDKLNEREKFVAQGLMITRMECML